ncbi:hypothetical protein C8R45DRAFT_965757 [Mycena sanguinolenta]|nr:hypothetical protein C8R45DRAFT_965757 [Mycena sanguinolenta]
MFALDFGYPSSIRSGVLLVYFLCVLAQRFILLSASAAAMRAGLGHSRFEINIIVRNISSPGRLHAFHQRARPSF